MPFAVQSVRKGSGLADIMTFGSRKKAESFAMRELLRGRGISLTSFSKRSERVLLQRGLGKTILAKRKFGKIFTPDFGRFSMK